MVTMVIGSSGFIGQRVTGHLLARSVDVVGFDTVSPSVDYPDKGRNFVLVRGDVTRLDHVAGAMAEYNVNSVILLAYVMAPLMDPEFKDLLSAAKVNVVGVTNVFEAARLLGVSRVVFGSTAAVFGPQSLYGQRGVTEEDQISPASMYGQMKALNESIGQRYRQLHGLEVVNVRPSAILGRGNTMWPSRLIDPIVAGEVGSAPFSRNGQNNLIGISDLVALYTDIVLADELRHDTYIASGHNFVGEELEQLVKNVLPDAQIEFDEIRPAPRYPVLYDNRRASEEFDWQIETLEDSLRHHIAEVQAAV